MSVLYTWLIMRSIPTKSDNYSLSMGQYDFFFITAINVRGGDTLGALL